MGVSEAPGRAGAGGNGRGPLATDRQGAAGNTGQALGGRRARGHSKVISVAFEKLEVGWGFPSRYQTWKFQLCPASTAPL